VPRERRAGSGGARVLEGPQQTGEGADRVGEGPGPGGDRAHGDGGTQSDEGLRFCPRCGGQLAERLIDRRLRPQCTACGYIWYKDPKVAAGTLPVLADGRIVLVRRAIEPQYGRWSYPGGYMDRGETVREAAIRETREECGLEVALQQLVDVYSYPNSIVVVVVFAARVTGGSLAPGPECLDARAFAREEIPWAELAFSSTRDALLDFFRRGGGAV
jgi:ADP-ribose pyrophosphatase YjhB (NUDIX family)